MGDQEITKSFQMATANQLSLEILLSCPINLDINRNGGIVLPIVAAESRWFAVEMLIEAKADLNSKDNKGCTALHWAARKGQSDIVDVLLKSKADVNYKCHEGMTPLDYAQESNHKEVIKMLK